jgi:hypothetical protein
MTGRASHATGARWVRVATFLSQDEARLLAGRLRAEGIDALTDPPIVLGSYYGPAVEVRMRQGIHVVVPENRALEAHRLIEDLNRS